MIEWTALRWWHWMAIALALGLVAGQLRKQRQADMHGDYVDGLGYCLGDQKIFEQSLTAQAEGRPRFRDIAVCPRIGNDTKGSSQKQYLVSGLYFTGAPEVVEGRHQGGWAQVWFLAHQPYEPMIDLSALNKPGGPDWSREYRMKGLSPSILDFLAVMHRAAGVQYRYAWWDDYPVLTSIIAYGLIGGVFWPLLMNLLAFGRVSKPQAVKGLSLWKVRNRPVSSTPGSAVMLGSDRRSNEAPPQETEHSDGTPAASPLSTIDDTPSPKQSPAWQSKEFATKPEDFYPTERKTPPSIQNKH